MTARGVKLSSFFINISLSHNSESIVFLVVESDLDINCDVLAYLLA